MSTKRRVSSTVVMQVYAQFHILFIKGIVSRDFEPPVLH
jgi:hypothetical protein